MDMTKYKKGAMTLSDGVSMALLFVVFVIVVAVAGQILAGVQGTQTAGSVAYSATQYGLSGVTNLSLQSGTIGLIIGAAIIIGVLMTAFYFTHRE